MPHYRNEENNNYGAICFKLSQEQTHWFIMNGYLGVNAVQSDYPVTEELYSKLPEELRTRNTLSPFKR